MIYAASPYTHPSKMIRQNRFEQVQAFCHHQFTRNRLFVHSPIAQWHPIMDRLGGKTCAATFAKYNHDFIKRSTQLFVLCLAEWWQSKGVQMEIELALDFGLHIRCYDYANYDMFVSLGYASENWK